MINNIRCGVLTASDVVCYYGRELTNNGDSMNLAFDTLDFAERAQKAGFTREQAEFQAREIAAGVENKLATKNDVLDLRKDLVIMQHQLIIKMGAMQVVSIGVLMTLLQFFK